MTTFEKPSIIFKSHQSHLWFCLMLCFQLTYSQMGFFLRHLSIFFETFVYIGRLTTYLSSYNVMVSMIMISSFYFTRTMIH